MDTRQILILAGTTEARELAGLLAPRADLSVTLSLAGRTQSPAPLPAPTRSGGFGGVDGLATYLRHHKIDLLVDATHPFAARISQNAAAASKITGIPLLRLERPGWEPVIGDQWTRVSTVGEAVAALPLDARRVFLAIGRQEASAFEAVPGHHYLVRSVDPVDPPLRLPQLETLLDRGPFSLEGELDLLTSRRIDVIVCKNSGGSATYAKIEAARQLGLPVIIVERPEAPATHRAATAEDAVALVDHLMSLPAKRGV